MTTPTTLPPGLAAILDQHRRVGLTGPPKSGKTTLARLVEVRHVISTDNFIARGWADQPRAIIDCVRMLGPDDSILIEGVQVPRCVRAGLVLDAIVWIEYVPEEQHKPMTKGMITVLQDVIRLRPDLPIYMYDRVRDKARRFTGGSIDAN